MRISRIPASELADLAANLVTLLSGTELSSIDSHVRAALIADFGTLPADLAAKTAAAAVIEGERKAVVTEKDAIYSRVAELSGRVRALLGAGGAPKEQYDICQFDFPAQRISVYTPQDPSNMASVGFSNGVNQLEFQGNNKYGLVTYDIWRREGDTGSWHQHAFTKKQRFEDKGTTPGQYYEYRVRAVGSRLSSNFSNSAVVYGVL